MDARRVGTILALFLSGAVLSSCGEINKNTNGRPSAAASNGSNENANTTRTNLEELNLVVNVPYEAEDIVWKEDTAHKKLIAVLLFSTENANKIVTEASGRQAPQNVTLSSETWFPAELIAQSQMTGDDTLHGTAYAASAFMQEPYTSGRIVRVGGTDYFVLELSAK